MRFCRAVVSLLVLTILTSMTGCESSSSGSSTTTSTPPPSAANEWTWEGGSNTASTTTHVQPGVYGTLGIAAAGNLPGGRGGAVSWTDSSGNLWLFGGQGFDSTGQVGELNDLWELNPASKEWTWMSGANKVGSNGGVSGVYGTLGVAATSNVPEGRVVAVSWTDRSGNLWLFGGYGFGSTGMSGTLNDLWKFDPASKEWTWVSGSNLAAPVAGGVYGTLGVAAAGNVPGARYSAVSWTDSSGNLWLFGGYGADSTGYPGQLNDLWKFDPGSKEWTWVSGANKVGSPYGGVAGVYGTLGVAAAGNTPGGRTNAVSWTDSSGNLWLFGGVGEDSIGTCGPFSSTGPCRVLNDLWKFDTSSKEWTWVSGANSAGVSGVYGTLGVAAVGNTPGGRSGAASWIDSSGNLWLFGGGGYDSTRTNGFLNDLWKYQP